MDENMNENTFENNTSEAINTMDSLLNLVSESESQNISFADRIYNEINSVIGGTNENQFFSMSLPGTSLEASQYSYDIKLSEPKPSYVKANESKLVNKLFDAAKVSGSDNGRHLSTQYLTALNMLSPKLNSKLFKTKNTLREILMTPYPYNFGDNKEEVLTLEQVFYKLYNEYVEAKRKWAEKQLLKKNEIARKYPAQNKESYKKRNNEFLDWYEIVAEAEVLAVDEKLGKVLSVFSPGDMNIINGILDSGVGREVAEAKSVMNNVGQLDPNGGYVYPVQLYPQNWFDLLDTSFTPIDLLESPAALSQNLKVLIAQRSNLTVSLASLVENIPTNTEVENLKQSKEESDAAFNKALSDLKEKNVHLVLDTLKTAFNVYGMLSKSSEDTGSVLERILGIGPNEIESVLGVLEDNSIKCMEAQEKLVSCAEKASTAALEYFEKMNQLQYKKMLTPLKEQLANTNLAIDALNEKISLSATIKSTSNVNPNFIPENFTQLLISSSMQEVNEQSSSTNSASISSHGASFIFGGYSNSKKHYEAAESLSTSQQNVNINIGMSISKVQIEREWFNPGVFLLTEDMYNTSSKRISPKTDFTEFNDLRFQEMNTCVFPCFPTSFVIARDVAISFSSSKSISNSFAKSLEEHSSKGGGFFIFGGSGSTASTSNESNSNVYSTAKEITIRFTTPQILGYYLESTPSDKTENINDANLDNDFISIVEFVNSFQKMLDEYNKKYHKQTLNL